MTVSRQAEWAKRWFVTVRSKLAECQKCGLIDVTQVEFAHIKETGLKGRGRGRFNRCLDIRKHPDSYTTFCTADHKRFDAGEFGDFVPKSLLDIAREKGIPPESLFSYM